MLHIEAYQLVNGEKEHVVSLDTIGLAHENENLFCLEYEETELIGVKGTTTQIFLPLDDKKKVIVKRVGTSKLEQVFVAGKRHRSSYYTPYGEMEIEILPVVVKVKRSLDEIDIRLAYDLIVSSQYVGHHNLNIKGKLKVVV